MANDIKKYMALIEANSTISTAREILDYVESIHGREEDFDEGDLTDRINKFDTFELKTIPIRVLYLDEFDIDEDYVEEVIADIKEKGRYSPIVFDPFDKSIIDGNHRANALHKLGHTEIRAHVGKDIDPHYTFVGEEDCDDEDDGDLEETTLSLGGVSNNTPANEFIDEVNNVTEINPISNGRYKYYDNEGIVKFSIAKLSPNTIYLTDLHSTLPKHGNASRFMEMLLEIADKHQVTIELLPSPLDRSISKQDLINFYKKFGFVGNASKMTRSPKIMNISEHIVTRIKNVLLESFKDALEKFSNDAPTDEVQSYLDKFRQLTKKNIITGTDKDIGKWIKGDWVDFKGMIDSKSSDKSKSQIKKAKKKDSIVVYEDSDKMVVVPLSKDASCFYGRQTKWCTAATGSNNEFNGHFVRDSVTLFYVLLSNGDKYAAAYGAEVNDFELFDKLDDSMSDEDFTNETGVSLDQIRKLYNENRGVIEKARENSLCIVGDEAIESGDPEKVYRHVRDILDGPFPKGEDIISADVEYSYLYANYVLKGSFPKGEGIISTNAKYSYMYANDVLKSKPFPKGEDIISTNAELSYRYAMRVLKGKPFPKGENIIATSASNSIAYAMRVLKGSFPKGEKAMAQDIYYSGKYIEFLNDSGFEKEAKQFKEKYKL